MHLHYQYQKNVVFMPKINVHFSKMSLTFYVFFARIVKKKKKKARARVVLLSNSCLAKHMLTDFGNRS